MKYSTWDKLYLIGLSSGLLLSVFVILVLSVLVQFVNKATGEKYENQTMVTPIKVESKEGVKPFVVEKVSEKPTVKVVPAPLPVVKEPTPAVKVVSEPTSVVKDSVVIKQDTTK